MIYDVLPNVDTKVSLFSLLLMAGGGEFIRRNKFRLRVYFIVALFLLFGIPVCANYQQHQTLLATESAIRDKLGDTRAWTADRISEELHIPRNLILRTLEWGVARGTFGCKRDQWASAYGTLVVYVYFNAKPRRLQSPSPAH